MIVYSRPYRIEGEYSVFIRTQTVNEWSTLNQYKISPNEDEVQAFKCIGMVY